MKKYIVTIPNNDFQSFTVDEANFQREASWIIVKTVIQGAVKKLYIPSHHIGYIEEVEA